MDDDDLDACWSGAEDIAFAHVYGQYQWHDAATIRGNRLGLTALRDAINAALSQGDGEAAVFATDGEGYAIKIHCTEVVSVIGAPEYLYALEYKMGEHAAERERELRLNQSKTTALQDH